jgi:acid phosphatase
MKRAGIGAVVALVLAACAITAASGSVARASRTATIPAFKHVVVVVFENHGYDDIAGNASAPTFNTLATTYGSITAYDGVSHPSLPNYLALVSGSTHGIKSDCTICVVKATNLADSLDKAHKSWKTYAEDLPSAGYTGKAHAKYAKRHDPFMYFKDINTSKKRRAHIVPFTRLATDVNKNQLPAFSLIVPNLCDDMHDCDVATGDAWLQNNIVPLINSPAMTGGVVFVVFDEAEKADTTGGGGHIFAIAAGPAVTPASTFATATNHYGLLRTIEDAWKLPRLAKSKSATPITGIWQG